MRSKTIFHQRQTLASILAISFIGILAYGLMIPWVGIYWDDWPLMFVMQNLGFDGVMAYTSVDRPSNGIVYALGYSFFGQSLVLWHISALILRLVSGIFLYIGLRIVWPSSSVERYFIALIFVVFPGFSQQSNALIYFVHHITLLLIIISITTTLIAIRASNRSVCLLFTIVSVLTGLGYQILLEFFLGAECVRAALVFITLWRMEGERSRLYLARKTATTLLPYVLVVVAFLIWRVFLFTSTREATSLDSAIFAQLRESPLGYAFRVTAGTIRDFFDAVVYSWFTLAHNTWSGATTRAMLAGFAIMTVATLFTFITARTLKHNGESFSVTKLAELNEIRQMMIVGLFSFPFAIIIPLLTGRHIMLDSTSDRYVLPALIPTALITVGFSCMVLKSELRIIVLALLIGLSVSAQFMQSNIYKNEWGRTQDMWWQIVWRIPALEDDTTILVEDHDTKMLFNSDYVIWGAANLLYGPSSGEIVLAGQFLDSEVLSPLSMQAVVQRRLRSLDVTRDYRASIVVVRSDTSCLRVIDPVRQELPGIPSGQLIAAARYSNTDRIIVDAASPAVPTTLFGNEPVHGWCYYFQKADLARQMADYDQVVALYDEVQRQGYVPKDSTEWYPFLESLVIKDHKEEATALIDQLAEADESVADICTMLLRLDRVDLHLGLDCTAPAILQLQQ